MEKIKFKEREENEGGEDSESRKKAREDAKADFEEQEGGFLQEEREKAEVGRKKADRKYYRSPRSMLSKWRKRPIDRIADAAHMANK